MTQALHPGHPVIEWGSAGRALGDSPEGSESGDLCVVVETGHRALVGVIDGLGHGAEAAVAARAAGQVLETHALEDVSALVRRCHEEVRRTRGVVMSLASFDAHDSSLTWVAVGNVDGVLLRADSAARPRREGLSLRGGVVGYQLPPLRATRLVVARGDTLIFATDGIHSGFTTEVPTERAPQEIADAILARHWRFSDDALVLVARYAGGAP